MTRLAPTLQTYFTTRLTSQFGASPHTLIAYRDTWRLLPRFIADTTNTPPQDLQLSALTAGVISDFLNHLETVQGNAISTHNARLAALHSFFTYAAYHPPRTRSHDQPDHGHPVQATPPHRPHPPHTSRSDRAARSPRPNHPGRATRPRPVPARRHHRPARGRTDQPHARRPALRPRSPLTCLGKGRKNRITPLDAQTVAVLRAFTTPPTDTEILFPTRTGTPMSRDALAKRLTQHTATTSMTRSTLTSTIVTPHVLRHTAAMRLLTADIDTTVIALWLSHESIETTQTHPHADMTAKQTAMDRTTPTGTEPGRYRPTDDQLLTFLQSL